MSRRACGAIAVSILVAAVCTQVAAHVAPAVKDNNRYIKLTLLGDRLRLSYTIYIGEIPGKLARAKLDKDHSGDISDAESGPYGKDLAAAVRKDLDISVDGTKAALAWDEVSVGLGTPETNAGAFSVDLVAWLCLGRPDPKGRHSLVFYDHYRVERAGETELRVEESPGVTVARSTMAEDGRMSQTQFKWIGAGGPTDKLGYYLTFRIKDSAVVADDGKCPAPGSEEAASGGLAKYWWILVLVIVVVVAAFVAMMRRRARSPI